MDMRLYFFGMDMSLLLERLDFDTIVYRFRYENESVMYEIEYFVNTYFFNNNM